MFTRTILGTLTLTAALAGCSTEAAKPAAPPELVSASALDKALLSASEVAAAMGTTAMTAHPRVEVMGDHRNLLPNLNCLGIWQVNETGVYGTEGAGSWSSLRQELLRAPDTDAWQNLVVQSAVNYPSTEAARQFFDQSSDRWSKCTNHNVNITLNGQKLPRWRSGDLTKGDDELAIPFTRDNGNGNGNGNDSCQRVLAVENNVIVDVQACKRDASTVTQAGTVAQQIEAKLPR